MDSVGLRIQTATLLQCH